ncbi:hypothetical protein HYN48_13850 [Flavobacterium magnum]|uniref:Smf/DprA SLOG domain-containing protein n=1 Tax=Flavobacterium magnum TaxID=2162713 RepID=A0A2S0RK37_9FLAO|nr:DNA-processing protein DprA [Flavobacterium magnum]AWA31082.1 hypothetical protein HYN48_13850 [Flavobacterium magnum]
MRNSTKITGIIALANLKGIGPAFVKKAISNNCFNSSNYVEEIKRIIEPNNKFFEDDIIFESVEYAKEIIFKCQQENIEIIDLTSEDYPPILKELKDAPSILYCKGNLELLYQNTICIIGTREPNENGEKIAERIGSYFSQVNWNICNGLAQGIDSFAIQKNNNFHQKIIGVLAGGLNYNSKKTLLKRTAENAERTLESGGLLISEIPPDKKEDTFTVVKSCRIQAGLSKGLVIIQSSIDGGSRFTTKAFCETARPIAIINPIQADYTNLNYNANIEIIENKKKGLSKFTEIKEDKILTSTIFTIKSRDDYQEFENILNSEKQIIKHTTLFS